MNLFGGGLTGWLGFAGIAILVIVAINLLVRRLGGWLLFWRSVRRELVMTARAWYEPVATSVRYRRRLRFLTGVLRSPRAWGDAERAIGHAASLSDEFEPYGLVLGKDRIGVLVAGGAPSGELPQPWSRDRSDPRLWWIARAELDGYSVASGSAPVQAPLLTCLGTDSTGRTAVLLDLLAGPEAVSVYGVPRTARSVVQAVAAQLDVRLPAGAVEVAAGVHQGHAGRSMAEAVKRLDAWFLVGAEPLEIALPAGIRLVSLGVARGSSRLIEALPDGSLRLHGTAGWLRVDPLPLARAVARSVRQLPPHDFEGQTPPDVPAADDDFDSLDLQIGTTGVSAVTAGDAGTDRKAPSWT